MLASVQIETESVRAGWQFGISINRGFLHSYAPPRNATHHGSQMPFKPKFISFDCCGTLINFEMGPAANRDEPTSDSHGVSRLTDVRQLPGLLGL